MTLRCKEQKRKLFHTSVYESELQLKKLYIQTCKRLPAYGCKVYQVKELLRGKTKKKVYQVKYLLRGKTKKKVRHYLSKHVMICQVYQVKYLLRGKTEKKVYQVKYLLRGKTEKKVIFIGSEPEPAWRESGKPFRKNHSKYTQLRYEPQPPRYRESSLLQE
uniref:Uncharacterized protein n=1 Tax=Timema cristinae TaxID=61476 RepID=A0A7R9CDZ3_TIMCR|nr:unnamed protein product [Timema cristinae]